MFNFEVYLCKEAKNCLTCLPVKELCSKHFVGQSICERWIMSCETLTTQFWKRYNIHPWKGEKVSPEGLKQLAHRLEEVGAKSLHESVKLWLKMYELMGLSSFCLVDVFLCKFCIVK